MKHEMCYLSDILNIEHVFFFIVIPCECQKKVFAFTEMYILPVLITAVIIQTYIFKNVLGFLSLLTMMVKKKVYRL